MNKARNRRIQSNVGLIVSIGSTACVIRIGLKYNGVVPMLNGMGRNLVSHDGLRGVCVVPMLNGMGRNPWCALNIKYVSCLC